jgi:hypothetical protein
VTLRQFKVADNGFQAEELDNAAIKLRGNKLGKVEELGTVSQAWGRNVRV